MAVFVINCTTGPDGLCPVHFVFGTIPRPAIQARSETQLERQAAITEAMKQVRRIQAQRRLVFGLKDTSSPKGLENFERPR